MITLNINPDKLKIKYDKNKVIDFSKSEINFGFSFYGMSMVLYVPSTALMNSNSELSPENQWDDGVNAMILNYDAKAYHRDVKYNSPSNESYYVSINPGINVGDWRLRNSGIWHRSYDDKSSYQNSYVYAEKDIRALKSKVLFGESSTGADIFNSIPFSGIKLATSDSMIPYFDRTSVPAIRGVANSVAQVEVRQNGYLIYSTEVPAGPFTLTDVPASQGQALDVTVMENNGTTQQFSIPYDMPAISMKAGNISYEITLGKFRPYSETAREDSFGNGTLIYGFNDFFTGYTGFQTSSHYWSGAVGMGFNLNSLGAISIDEIYARTEYGDKSSGSALRARYSKNISGTGTSFTLASYRYASEGYKTFADAMETWNQNKSYQNRKYDTSISMRQELFGYGSLDLMLSQTLYWQKERETYASVNYSGSLYRGISFSTGWNRTLNSTNDRKEDVFSTSISIPFNIFSMNASSTRINYQVISERDRSISNYVNLNGMTYDNRLAWNVAQSTNNKQHNNNRSNVNASLKNSFGTVTGMYNYSPLSTQYGGGINGSFIVHGGGITLGPFINGAAALVDTDGAEGIKVTNRAGIKTDDKGYAIVTPLNTYRKNDISVKQAGLKKNTDIAQTISSVIPTDNALVKASFKNYTGKKAIFSINGVGSSNIPFGATVMSDHSSSMGVMDEDGNVYLSGLADTGVLTVKWGESAGQQCKAFYQLNKSNDSGLYFSVVNCM
ncbi:fimbrial biogenesis outer membrane usher protein [Salmonella enterica]